MDPNTTGGQPTYLEWTGLGWTRQQNTRQPMDITYRHTPNHMKGKNLEPDRQDDGETN